MIVSDERVAQFVSHRLGVGLCPPYSTIGIERNGRIVAGAVFNQFEGPDVAVSIAGTGWSREFMRQVGRYVYDTLGCERMTVTTEFPQVASYAERLGGKREGLLRNHFGAGRDGIIVGILRDEYRFHRALECVGAFG